MFFKKDLYIPKVTAQWSRSDPKVIPNHPHIPESDPKVTRKCSGSLGCVLGWGTRARLDPFKNALKTHTFSTFSLFGPTKHAHMPITLAISCFSTSNCLR